MSEIKSKVRNFNFQPSVLKLPFMFAFNFLFASFRVQLPIYHVQLSHPCVIYLSPGYKAYCFIFLNTNMYKFNFSSFLNVFDFGCDQISNLAYVILLNSFIDLVDCFPIIIYEHYYVPNFVVTIYDIFLTG